MINKIKTAFINPDYKHDVRHNIYQDLKPLPPMGIGYLVGYLMDKGYNNFRIYDEQLRSLDDQSNFQDLVDYQPDIVGISCFSSLYPRVLQIVDLLRNALPNTFVLLGGPHPSLEAESTLHESKADFIFRGESEITLHGFLQGFESRDFDNITGLSYIKDGQVTHHPDTAPLKQLDVLPRFPYEYFFKTGMYELGTYISSRGCPYKCTFCASRYLSGLKYRSFSAERVVDDLEVIINKFNIKYIQFHDDNFNLQKERLKKICDLIIERKLKLRWWCQTRSDFFTRNEEESLEILKLMHKAGCCTISLGIESGSPRLLKLIKKGETIEQHIKAAKLIRKAKINVAAGFVIALPSETKSETKQTIKFAKSLKLDWAYFSIFVPFPGTVYFDEMKKNEKVNWDSMWFNPGIINKKSVSYVPEGMTHEEIIKTQKKAIIMFWLSFRSIYNFVSGKISPYGEPHRLTFKEAARIFNYLFTLLLEFCRDKFSGAVLKNGSAAIPKN